MADERCGNERRSMTISVSVLGITLCIVFLAYFAFSEHSDNTDASTIKFATIVSIELNFLETFVQRSAESIKYLN